MKRQLFILLLSLLIVPIYTQAHGYWIETEGSHKVNEPFTIKLYFGEYGMGETLSDAYLDRMKEIKVYVLLSRRVCIE